MDAFSYQNDLLPVSLELLTALLGAVAFLWLRNAGMDRAVARGIHDRAFWTILVISSGSLALLFAALQPIVTPWGGLDRYFVRALNLVRTGVFGYGDFPTAWFPPGYSFVLAPLALLCGDTPWAFFLTNLALLIASTLVVRRVLRLLGAAPRTTNLLPLAIFLYPNRCFSTLLPFSDVPFSLLFGAALLAVLLRMHRAAGWRSALVVGMLGGCAALVRNNGLAMVPALLAGVVLTSGPGRSRRWGHALVMAAAFVIVLLPWLVRNRQVTGDIVPLALNGGVNLAIGNNASGSATFNNALDSVWTDKRVRSVLGGGGASEVRRDSFYRALGTEYVMNHPGEFLTLAPRKIGRTFAADNYSFSALTVYTNFRTIGASLGRRWALPPGGAAALNSVVATAFTMLIVVNSVLYYLLLFWTVVMLWKHRKTSGAWLWTVLLALAGTCALVVLTFGLSRFKEPMGIILALTWSAWFAIQGNGASPGKSEKPRSPAWQRPSN